MVGKVGGGNGFCGNMAGAVWSAAGAPVAAAVSLAVLLCAPAAAGDESHRAAGDRARAEAAEARERAGTLEGRDAISLTLLIATRRGRPFVRVETPEAPAEMYPAAERNAPPGADTAPGSRNPDALEARGQAYGSKYGKVYHLLATCPAGRRIRPEHRIEFISEVEARRTGRHTCGLCLRILDRRRRQRGTGTDAASAGRTKPETGGKNAMDTAQ